MHNVGLEDQEKSSAARRHEQKTLATNIRLDAQGRRTKTYVVNFTEQRK